MLRITAVGAGAVDYLLRGSGCDHAKEQALDGPDRDPDREPDAAGYFASAVEHGEPAGRWLGSGMEGLGLDARPGDVAVDDDVRAIYGQLRRPESSEDDPEWIGCKPRRYRDTAARLSDLVAKEPDASEERLRELELQAATSGRRAVAYYDFTFSPAKSVSVYYAALLAAGLTEEAEEVRAAHDEAVRIAVDYAEQHIPYTRTGYHGLDGDGRSVGDFVRGTGLSVIAFGHSTSREAEPQLHTHAAVLNRVATPDGHIGALDSKGFRAIKEGIATTYERAVEQLVTEATGAQFAERPDGLAREIVGVDPELCAEASTRRGQVTDRVGELVEAYRERHDAEPDAAARKAMAQAATLETRRPKSGLAGPAAVAEWAEQRREWCEEVLDQVDAAALAATVAANADMAAGDRPVAAVRGDGDRSEPVAASGRRVVTDPAAARQAWLDRATAAGVADVQTRYATWTLGNLIDAIDRHLGEAGALGVPATERAGVVEDLARAAVAPHGGHGVVQLSGHEPVAVPDALRRIGPGEDGRPRFRPHMDERYATAAHLGLEERVVALARADRGPALASPELDARLVALGLGEDQRAAVEGVLRSGRGGDVLIGPAGAGKSRTVGALAGEWTSATGGRAFGVATSQIATANLAGDGLEALNLDRFLRRFRPDEQGRAQDTLGPGDLVVVDEAGMSATADLEQLAGLVAAAGGKVLYTGDHQQLGAVGAGGLFAHLAESLDDGQRHELHEVHRFREQWERDASLQLRDGDHAAIAEYADRGRLHTGSLEDMQDQASRAYVADTLSGRTSLLIVGTNAQADALSRSIRQTLIDLGRVSPTTLGLLHDGAEVSAGDRIQARRNDPTLRVEPTRDEHGQPSPAVPVTNRATYAVMARDDRGDLLVRDEHGAIAHLPEEYVREHVSLGYATTVHGAQGVTVDTAHPVLDRDATREQAYVGASRGREANHLWLVTDREPDEHDPQRVADDAAERLAAVLDTTGAQTAATATRQAADEDLETLAAAVARFDVVTGWADRDRHQEALAARLSPEDVARLRDDAGRDRLLRSLRGADLAGHDTVALLDEVTEGSLVSADSVADVLRARVRAAEARRTPERVVDPADWATRSAVAAGDDDTSRYVAEVAALATARQTLLGERTVTEQPAWALEALGEVPDRETAPEEHADWQRRAGIAAAYRELSGLREDQASLGEPPSRERELNHALWRDAVEALGPRDHAAKHDFRAAADAELYAVRERWARERDTAPPWVAEQLADTHELAREYAADAALERARLTQLGPDDPDTARLSERVERSEWFAEQHQRAAAELEVAHQERATWWTSQTSTREADAAAADELARRGLAPQRDPDASAAPQPEPDSFEVPVPDGPATQAPPATDDERVPEVGPEPDPESAEEELDVPTPVGASEPRDNSEAPSLAPPEPEPEPEPHPEPEAQGVAPEPEPERSEDPEPEPEPEPAAVEPERSEAPELREAAEQRAAARDDLAVIARQRREAEQQRVEREAAEAQRGELAAREGPAASPPDDERERSASADAEREEATAREPEPEVTAPEPERDDDELE